MGIAGVKARVLTLVFTDLVDSVALKSRVGDKEAAQIIQRHFDALRDTLQDTGGREIQASGDGCFLTFETPSTAVEFALRLQKLHVENSNLPALRVGIHMGEVTERTGSAAVGGAVEVEGLAVDLASRIQSLSLPNQILLSYPVFDNARQRLSSERIDGTVGWRAHGRYVFKGHDDGIHVFEVGFEGMGPFAPPVGSEKAHRDVSIEEETTLGWRPAQGIELPGRPHWIVSQKLGEGGFGDVWLVEQVKTGDRHVAKFCYAVDRLRALKREVTLFRILKQNLGDRNDIGRVIDYQFDSAPYYLEMEYAGRNNLNEWLMSRGGAEQVPLHERLELVAEAASALAAAHSVGVLHKDVKPSNLMVDESGRQPFIKVIDFGIGALDDRGILAAKGITATGLTDTSPGQDYNYGSLTGTRLYMAPELIEGKPASIKSDIYSLGVILYQVVSGNLSHSLATGWQRDVSDELLRQDIESCVDGRPENRLASAEELARRLRSLDERHRLEALKQERIQRENRQMHRRRLLLIAAGLAAVLLLVAGIFALQQMQRAESEELLRKRAEQLQKTALAEKNNTEVALNEAEHLRYMANISLAEAALRDGRIDKVQEILLNETPMKFLGREWGWLLAQTAPEDFAFRNLNIFDAVFSPDGKTFATGDRRDRGAGWVAIYDRTTARPIRQAQIHTRLIWNLAYSPDGSKIVTASSDNFAKIVDAKTLEVLHDLRHRNIVRDALFSPDSRFIATASRDRTVVLWDAGSGNKMRTFNLPGESPTQLAISPDSRLVAAATLERKVHIWNAETGEELPTLFGTESAVLAVVFDRNGKRIFTGSSDGGVRTYLTSDLQTTGGSASDGKTTRILPVHQLQIHDSYPVSLKTMGGSNKIVAGCDNGTVAVIDPDLGEELFQVHCDQPLWKLDLSPDSRYVLAASRWSTRMLDMDRLQPPVTTVTLGTTETIPGAIPIRISSIIKIKDQTWRYDIAWRCKSGRTLATIGNYKAVLTSFYDTYSPDHSVRIKVDPETLNGQAIRSHDGKVLSNLGGRNILECLFAPDGNTVYIARAGTELQAFDTRTWQSVNKTKIKGWPPGVINACLAISPDGKQLVVGLSNGAEEVFTLPSLQHVKTFKPDGGSCICMDYSSDGRYLAVGYDTERGRVWDMQTSGLVSVLNGHVRYIHGILFSPDDRNVLTMSRDGTAKLWDRATGRELVTLFNLDPSDAIVGAAFTPDGHHVIGAAGSGNLFITEMFPWNLSAYDDGTTDSLERRIERWKRKQRMPAFDPQNMEKETPNAERSNVTS